MRIVEIIRKKYIMTSVVIFSCFTVVTQAKYESATMLN